jgi:hypothetical protein
MRRRIKSGGGRLTAAMIMFGLLVPAGAVAAPAKPGVTTGPAANVGQQTATLTGKVNPNEAETTYFFEYGTTTLYGTSTPQSGAGHANKAANTAAAIGGLAPATRYHYRLVAFNAKGVTRGGDRTFTTQRQPLGLSLAATPNPIRPNAKTLISGVLSGTGNGDRRIVLQSNPFPFTQGFQTASDQHLTNADGSFSFPLLAVPVNTQYRVVLPNVPEVQSPIVTVGVQPKVTISRKRVTRLAHGASFRFSGKILPAHDGAEVIVQRLRNGAWVNVAHTAARAAKGDVSKYRKRVKVRHSGTYRVFAGTNNGANVESTSKAIRVRVR